jgi:AcrR family transcriptional regulator
MSESPGTSAPQAGYDERRTAVLDAALRTFARFGYRKTSMDDVAAEAHISRPGLYFLFSSKSGLFRAAAERAIELDLASAERALAAPDRALVDRVAEAFDCWAGRYIGAMSDVPALLEENPGLLGPIATTGSDRFAQILTSAIESASPADDPRLAAQTLISVSIGLKHQATSREGYTARMRSAALLILRP